MVSSRITLLDPIARVTVREERIVVRTVGVQGPPGPPTITPGAVVTAEGDLIVGGPGGTPQALPMDGSGKELVIGYAGVPEWRDLPSRNILDRIDPVAADHTDEVKQAFEDYPHWHIPPGVTVKLEERVKDHVDPPSSDCVVIPFNGSLIGQDPDTSMIQVTTDQNVNDGVDGTYAVLLLAGSGTEDTQPRQRLATFNFVGSASTPMTWTNKQAAMVYENNAWAVAQGIVRNAPISIDRVRFSNYRGFPLHIETSRAVVRACDFIDCGNGANINGDRCAIEWCYFERSEGCEMSGIAVAITNNIFVDVFQTACNVGGFFDVDHPEYNAGYISGNRIYGVSGTGVAITVAQSMSDTHIVNNYIEDPYIGIQTLPAGAYLTNGALIQGNTIVSARSQGIASYSDNDRILANRVYNRPDLAGEAAYALLVAGDDVIIDHNTLVGVNASTILSGALRVVWGPSNITPAGANDDIDVQGGTTFARRSVHGTVSIADGGTIAHGLGVAPTWVGLTPKVGGRIAVVAGLSSTTITIDLEDSAGADITVAEDVMWRAEI